VHRIAINSAPGDLSVRLLITEKLVINMNANNTEKTRSISYLSITIFLLLPITSFGYDDPPKKFKTRSDAVNNSCEIQTIKENNIENCIISKFEGHNLIISIYDSNLNGEFARTNQLMITSWYQEANISYDDLLGNGIKFIRVEFEGNTGTGTLQKILSYWGWQDDKFVPVLFETKSYYISDRYLEELKVNDAFVDKGSKQVSVILNYQYFNNSPKHKSKYVWREKLNWHDSSFSFYNQEQEKKKLLRASNPIYKKIINARLNHIKRKRSMRIIDTDLLNEIEIMQILYEEVY
jgi:hypothetical protein